MKTYKTRMKEMSNEDLLSTINHLHDHLHNDFGTTPNLTKLAFATELAKKRGITTEEITEYCNSKDEEQTN